MDGQLSISRFLKTNLMMEEQLTILKTNQNHQVESKDAVRFRYILMCDRYITFFLLFLIPNEKY